MERMIIESVKGAFNAECATAFDAKMGMAIVYCTMPKVSGGQKGINALNAELGSEFQGKLTMMSNARSYNYANAVENQALREAMELDKPFEPQKPKGKTHVTYNVLVCDKDPSIYYLNLLYLEDGQTSFETRYIVDGRFATPEEVAIIKRHLYSAPNKGASQPQERKVNVRTVTFTNIVMWGKRPEVSKWWDALAK